MFGGQGAGAAELGDTWVWDGTTWEDRSSSTLIPPPARHNASMAYDAARGEIVLFGGSNRDLGVLFDETWTWNGTEWTLETPDASPPARSAASMAYDPATRRTVMFGGYNANVERTDTTWQWNGETWFESLFGERPPPRAAGAMTYSGALKRILLFGGNAALGDHLSDTWKWTGDEWKPVVVDGSPGGRFAPGLGYHPPSRSTVLFGGNANVFLDDTWTWRSNTPEATIEPSAHWTRYGAGWLRDFALADLDVDSRNEVMVGGFGLGALDDRSVVNGRYRWMNKWPDQPDPSQGDDNELAYDIDVDDVNGDGVPDTLAGTSMGLMGFDGRDGRELYRIPNDGAFNDVQEIGTGDLNDDGVKDVVYTYLSDMDVIAADGRDGSMLWRGTRTASFTTQIDTADLNDDGATDALVIGSGGLGSNIDAFSGAGAVATGTATPLWSKAFPGGDPAVFKIGQIIAGGPKEIVVGGYLGEIEVMNATTGATLATWKVVKATDLELVQMDGDADLEIAIATGYNDDNGESTTVHTFDPLGQSLWNYEAPMPPIALDSVDLDDDGSNDLVVGGGFYEFRGRNQRDGFVVGLDPRVEVVAGGAPPVHWETTTPTRVGFVDHGPVLGAPTILAGEDVDPYLRGLRYDGTERFVYRLGGHPRDVAAVDINGDGRPEILEGGTDAEVAVHDRRGDSLWHVHVPGKATPDVETVHAGQLTDDPGSEVVAGTFDFGRGEGGHVRVFTSDGRPLWSDTTAGPVGTVLVTDLEDDDTDDLLVASSGVGLGGGGSQIARYEGDGTPRWKSPTPPSMTGPYVETVEVNGDGVEDIIVLTIPFGQSFVLAYDGATGAELWRFAPESIGQWLDVRSDVDDGITFGDLPGRIFRLSTATGEVVWRRQVDGASRDGTWTADGNADGVPDIATSGDSGIVHLLSGVDGSDLWTQPLDGEDRALQVASISGTDKTHVAVGSYTNTNGARSGVYFFDPFAGSRVGKFETEGHVKDIEPVDLNGDGNEEAVTAAGLQIYAIDLFGGDPEPEPTPTSTPAPTASPSSSDEPPPRPPPNNEPTPSSNPSSEPPPASRQESARHEATGHIAAFNPASDRVTGVTETEFLAACDIPATQGVDGHVFALPERFANGDAFADVTGANAMGLYDLDAYFYSAACDELRPAAATASPDEAGIVPAGTGFVVVNAFVGADTTVRLEVTAPGSGTATTTNPPPTMSSSSPTDDSPKGANSSPGGPSASAHPSSTTPPRGTPTVTIGSDRSMLAAGRPGTLSGLADGDAACDPKIVEIRRRRPGATSFTAVARKNVADDGTWSMTLTPKRNASYSAHVESTHVCEEASSAPIDVLVRAKIDIVGEDIACRPPTRVSGRITPLQSGGRALLQRKVEGRWKRVDFDVLDRRSRFVLAARSCGKHRVFWPGNASNAPSTLAFRRALATVYPGRPAWWLRKLVSAQTRPSKGSGQPFAASGVIGSSVIDQQPTFHHAGYELLDILIDRLAAEPAPELEERLGVALLIDQGVDDRRRRIQIVELLATGVEDDGLVTDPLDVQSGGYSHLGEFGTSVVGLSMWRREG